MITSNIMEVISYERAKEINWRRDDSEEMPLVRKILDAVKLRGDDAVNFYNQQFDGISLNRFDVTDDEIKQAYNLVSSETISAIKAAAKNIRTFATQQMTQIKDLNFNQNGVELGHRIVPINSIGCYVPGGNYPLPSSALMSVIPAKVAGVKNVIVCSPKIQPVTIVAAHIAGADKIYKIGGVQAIGAMAYGTKSVFKVDKIVGPGNKYVSAAKKEVYGIVGIDFLAGPSEVLIIADEGANPRYIAADLLAQAEHDVDARANLIITSRDFESKVQEELFLQLANLKTKDIALQSLKKGKIILVSSLDQAVLLSNQISPEHLELQVSNPDSLLDRLTNYGSLFIGKYSAEVFGDYCSGPNHILPTSGVANYSGGLSVKDFVKVLTYQKASSNCISELIDIASKLANAEGLDGHRNAAEIRKN